MALSRRVLLLRNKAVLGVYWSATLIKAGAWMLRGSLPWRENKSLHREFFSNAKLLCLRIGINLKATPTLLHPRFRQTSSTNTLKTKPPLRECYTCFECQTKTGVVRILIFFNPDVCSATSMESSRQDLLNDMAKHRAILKNNQNTYYPRLSFTTKTGIELAKTDVLL